MRGPIKQWKPDDPVRTMPVVRFLSCWTVAVSLLAALACYDGDQLGFAPCDVSDECDAPPRAAPRRRCLFAAEGPMRAGYCALPCANTMACVGESPGDAGREATCGAQDENAQQYCILQCNNAQPCPTAMECLSYVSESGCADDETCICFPVTPSKTP